MGGPDLGEGGTGLMRLDPNPCSLPARHYIKLFGFATGISLAQMQVAWNKGLNILSTPKCVCPWVLEALATSLMQAESFMNQA